MNKSILLGLASGLLILTHTLYASTWMKTYGGAKNDVGYGVTQTADGGYITTGKTYSYGAGNADMWLVKTDDFGNVDWTKAYGGSLSDWGYAVEQTFNGDYIVVGRTMSFSASEVDLWLVKTNSSGDTIWTRTYGGNEYDVGYSVKQTSDSSYIVAGLTGSYGAGSYDVWLIKLDSQGDTLWTKTYGGEFKDRGQSVQQTNDGGYIIAGGKGTSGGMSDLWLIKTDEFGDTEWSKTYGKTYEDVGYSVQQTADDGYIVVGRIQSYKKTLNDDAWLLKTDSLGDTLWTRIYGGDFNDIGRAVDEVYNGYIIAGVTSSYGAGNSDAWLLRVDSLGNTLWTKTFGGSDVDWSWSVQQIEDKGFIIAGATYSYGASGDLWLIKTDSLGKISTLHDVLAVDITVPGDTVVRLHAYTPTAMVGNNSTETESFRTYLKIIKDGKLNYSAFTTVVDIPSETVDTVYFSPNWVPRENGHYKAELVVQLESDPIPFNNIYTATFYVVDGDKAETAEQNVGQTGIYPANGGRPAILYCSPNPFSKTTVIRFSADSRQRTAVSLKIYDLTGRLVKIFNHLTNQPFNQITWDGKDNQGIRVPGGIYFIKLQSGKHSSVKKAIVIH